MIIPADQLMAAFQTRLLELPTRRLCPLKFISQETGIRRRRILSWIHKGRIPGEKHRYMPGRAEVWYANVEEVKFYHELPRHYKEEITRGHMTLEEVMEEVDPDLYMWLYA